MTGGRPFTPPVAIPRPDWFDAAACRGLDPDLFFPSKQGEILREALAVCAECPVREACLDWAIDTGESAGVWGGVSGKERDRIAARRRGVGVVAAVRSAARRPHPPPAAEVPARGLPRTESTRRSDCRSGGMNDCCPTCGRRADDELIHSTPVDATPVVFDPWRADLAELIGLVRRVLAEEQVRTDVAAVAKWRATMARKVAA